MEPGSVVRVAQARDLEALRALFRAYREEVSGEECFAGFEAELDALPATQVPPLGGLWVAEARGEALGCVALRPRQAGAGEAELRRLYLRPAARGQGLARRLVETVREAARAAGHRRLYLETLPTMTAARALYAKLGWREEAAAGARLGYSLDLAARWPAT